MKLITAKFNSKCTETGKPLKKGDTIYYDPTTRRAYHKDAEAPKNATNNKNSNPDAWISEALETAYFGNPI